MTSRRLRRHRRPHRRKIFFHADLYQKNKKSA